MTLKEIEIKINQMAKIIDAEKRLLPTYGYSMDFARPHIEVDDRGIHFVVVERGKEQYRLTTDDIDEILFRVFSGVISAMSYTYELKNRDETKDCRRMAFKKQEELLGMLNSEWKKEAEERHRAVQFDDNASRRAKYFKELRDQGFLEKEIERLAYEKFPKP